MNKWAYYNEIDPYAAQWLRNLIAAGFIPAGDVDERSIAVVQPDDLCGYIQCHFFAGLGGWAYASRLAGWPSDRALWTGSCPCQPFSVAGKGRGTDDERHLWPDFFRLIRACRPAVIMGEQVAGKAGYGWLDGVRSDLAGEGYASRGVDIPACSVDAPHIRSRIYWVAVADADSSLHNGGWATGPQWRDEHPDGDSFVLADSDSERLEGAELQRQRNSKQSGNRHYSRNHRNSLGNASCAGLPLSECEAVLGTGWREEGRAAGQPSRALEYAESERWREGRAEHELRSGRNAAPGAGGENGALGQPNGRGRQAREQATAPMGHRGTPIAAGRNGSFWSDHIWLVGADGKARRSQSDICLLVNGAPARVHRLRALGNAIVPQVAAEVIAAFMEVAP